MRKILNKALLPFELESAKVSIKIIVILAIVTTLGLPLDTAAKASVLGICTFFLFASPIRSERKSYAVATVCFLSFLIIKSYLSPSPVSYGYNLFAPNTTNFPLYKKFLPEQALALFSTEFQKDNPTVDKCTPVSFGRAWGRQMPCFNSLNVDSFPFAVSVVDYSQIHQIDPASIHLDSARKQLMELNFNTNYRWHLHNENINKSPYSFYVMFEINKEMVGGKLCRAGVYWSEQQAIEERLPQLKCESISQDRVGERIWGLQTNELHPLVFDFSPSSQLKWKSTFLGLLGFLTAVIILIFVLAIEKTSLDYLVVGAISIFVVTLTSFDILGGLHLAINHSDSLLYLSWARDISISLAKGDWADALRGGESIYLFMPGMRYFRSIEFLLFGISGLGYPVLMAPLLILTYNIFKLLIPGSLCAKSFTVFSILAATLYVKILRTANDGYPDPLGLLLLIISMLLLLRSIPDSYQSSEPSQRGAKRHLALIGFTCMAASIWMRPNIALVALAVALFWAYRAWRMCSIAIFFETIPLSLVLLMTLHNVYFGHQWVPLTEGATLSDNLRMPPSSYWKAVVELMNFAPDDYATKVISRLASWWLPGRWLYFFVPLYIVITQGKRCIRLWLLGLVTLLLQAPHFFYVTDGRHTMAADFLGLVCVTIAIVKLISESQSGHGVTKMNTRTDYCISSTISRETPIEGR